MIEKDRKCKAFFGVDQFPQIADWWKTIPEKILIGHGTHSVAYLVSSPNNQKYIVRITPVIGIQERQILQHEIRLYDRLRKDPNHLHHVSELLYADYPTVYHGVSEYDLAYFVFRYVEGLPLDTLIQSFQKSRKYLTLAKLKDWREQMLEILKFLDSHGIVHRDIKPANLFIDTTHDRVVVFDFGSACIRGESCRSYQFHGTRAYASPDSLHLLSHFPSPYEYSIKDDLYSMKVILEKDLSKLVREEDMLEYQQL